MVALGAAGCALRPGHPAAVTAIEEGRWSFYLLAGGREQPVVVAVSKYGSKYLKGAGDGLQPESLLALPECSRVR